MNFKTYFKKNPVKLSQKRRLMVKILGLQEAVRLLKRWNNHLESQRYYHFEVSSTDSQTVTINI